MALKCELLQLSFTKSLATSLHFTKYTLNDIDFNKSNADKKSKLH